jgi:hypothetical protein
LAYNLTRIVVSSVVPDVFCVVGWLVVYVVTANYLTLAQQVQRVITISSHKPAKN